jgi:sulfur dioxygenase
MNPTQLFDPASCTYTYIVYDEQSLEAVIIDPVDVQLERDLAALQRLGVTLKWTVETHAHADHITSAARLAELTGAHMAVPAGCEIGTAAVQLAEDPPTEATQAPLGHQMRPDQRHDERHVFTGDTLLIQGCGRTDFQSGDAGALYDSIKQKLFTLPDTAIVWPAHDYHERTQSTIGVEKATNPRLAGKSRDEFIALMKALDLPKPRRIDEAVPANRRSGLRQDAGAPPDAGGADGVHAAEGYAGELPPQTAHEWMQNGEAVLVDVRTDAEREWVGFVPGAQVVAWKQWPGMALNPDFDARIRALAQQRKPLMLLCRSGVRSMAAARRATELGVTAYNVMGGFEGDLDAQAQRGHKNGWRNAGLPWRQN